MRIRWIALAAGLALTATPALTACSASPSHQVESNATSQSVLTTQPTYGAPAPSKTSGGGASRSTAGDGPQPGQPPSGSSGIAVDSPVVSPGASPGVSNADLAQINQQLSDAANSLGAADADAAHNESGDATP